MCMNILAISLNKNLAESRNCRLAQKLARHVKSILTGEGSRLLQLSEVYHNIGLTCEGRKLRRFEEASGLVQPGAPCSHGLLQAARHFYLRPGNEHSAFSA